MPRLPETTRLARIRIAPCLAAKGKPVLIPLQGNPHFERAPGKILNFVQINLSRDGLWVCRIKEAPRKAYHPKTEAVGLDTGLKFLFATDQGDLLGAGLMARLLHYDRRLTACAAGRQRQGLRVRCDRYDALVQDLRGYLKNEIHRVLNRLVHRLAPQEIVFEDLDFRDSRRSRRMNRLLRNFGRGVAKARMDALVEEYGIVVTEVPAAHSSRACPNCHYTEKKNRKDRDTFACRSCGYTRQADVVGARNVRSRRSWPEAQAGSWRPGQREAILARLGLAHQQWRAHHAGVRSTRGRHSASRPPPENRTRNGAPAGVGEADRTKT